MKNLFRKNINRTIAVLIVLTMAFGSSIFVSANEEGSVKKYEETMLNVKTGRPEKVFFDTCLNKDGKLQSFEWTKSGGRKITWKGKKQVFKTVKIPKSIMNYISSNGDATASYGIDGCLYIITEKNGENILYGVGKKGKVVKNIKLPKLSNNGIQIRTPKQINKHRLAFTATDNVTGDYFVFVINKKTKKLASKYKTNIAVEEIKGKRVYGFSVSSHYDENNTPIIDNKELVVMNLYKNKIVNRVKVPGSFSFNHQVDVKDGFVYIASSNGVFRKKINGESWVNIMAGQYDNNLHTETALSDLTVANKNRLYLTFINEKDLPVLICYTNK